MTHSGVWLETTIAHRATLTDQVTYSLADIFNGLSNEIGRVWLQTAPEARERLIAAADIVYAESLVPSAFSGMVSHSSEGWQLNRLPASDDPMVARVERVRNQEYLFCDTIDEQYALMAEQVGPTYEMWRQATLEQAEWLAQYEQRAAMREAKASDSQFSRMHAQYAAYRSFRIQEQAFFELAKALDNESEPTGAQNGRSGGSPRGHALLPVQPVARATPGNIRFGATASIMVRHRYLATCPTAGVAYYLAQELAQLGAEGGRNVSGVSFEGGLSLAYRVCLWSRLANRVCCS